MCVHACTVEYQQARHTRPPIGSVESLENFVATVRELQTQPYICIHYVQSSGKDGVSSQLKKFAFLSGVEEWQKTFVVYTCLATRRDIGSRFSNCSSTRIG